MRDGNTLRKNSAHRRVSEAVSQGRREDYNVASPHPGDAPTNGTITRGSGYRRTLKEDKLWVGSSRGYRMQAQWSRNYQFFDAPVGLLFTINRIMRQGGLLDYGMFLQKS